MLITDYLNYLSIVDPNVIELTKNHLIDKKNSI